MGVSLPRIVSLLPAATEMLYAIGAGDRVVGISHECNWPPGVDALPRVTRSEVDSSANSGTIDCQVQTLMQQGAALYTVDQELLAALAPDLIATQSQCDICAVRLNDVVETVKSYPSLRQTEIVALNPQSLTDVLEDLVRVGEATGCGKNARDMKQKLLGRIEAIRSATSCTALENRPRVAVIEWVDPLMIAANWTPELVVMGGGEYGLAESGRHSRYTSWEDIRAYDPDCLIVAPCGFKLARAIQESQSLADLEGWRQIAAVRKGQVFVVDGDAYFNRPGPRLVETLEMIAAMLQPGDGARLLERLDGDFQAVARLEFVGERLAPTAVI